MCRVPRGGGDLETPLFRAPRCSCSLLSSFAPTFLPSYFPPLQELEQAILLAFDQEPSDGTPASYHRNALKVRASGRLESIRASPDGYLACLSLLGPPPPPNPCHAHRRHPHVSFFALSNLAHFLSAARVPSPPRREAIRAALLSFAAATAPQTPAAPDGPAPPYLVTKVAIGIALCVQVDYPAGWPEAFDTLLQLPPFHPELFLRVLIALVDEIVVFTEGRSAVEVERNSFIKDHVRGFGAGLAPADSVTARLLAALLDLVHAKSGEDPSLARLGLATLQQYIGWVDVSLVASEPVVSTLFASLECPSLAAASVSCLLELVNKGMDDDSKVSLLASGVE